MFLKQLRCNSVVATCRLNSSAVSDLCMKLVKKINISTNQAPSHNASRPLTAHNAYPSVYTGVTWPLWSRGR